MKECICNKCKNLKGVVNDSGTVEEYDCVFGFPSDKCEECSGEDCDMTCNHYVSDEEEESFTSVRCSSCGRELTRTFSDDSGGDVYCVSCYFDKR